MSRSCKWSVRDRESGGSTGKGHGPELFGVHSFLKLDSGPGKSIETIPHVHKFLFNIHAQNLPRTHCSSGLQLLIIFYLLILKSIACPKVDMCVCLTCSGVASHGWLFPAVPSNVPFHYSLRPSITVSSGNPTQGAEFVIVGPEEHVSCGRNVLGFLFTLRPLQQRDQGSVQGHIAHKEPSQDFRCHLELTLNPMTMFFLRTYCEKFQPHTDVDRLV